MPSGHGLELSGGGGTVTLAADAHAHVVILSGAEIRERVVVDGPFIMNDVSQMQDAFARYEAGRMGHLAPFSVPGKPVITPASWNPHSCLPAVLPPLPVYH